MNSPEVIPCIFYFYIHYKLREKFKERVISMKELKNFFFEWRLPKEIRPIIIKELELLKLIECTNRRAVTVNPSKFNLGDLRIFYKMVGIY